jgi:hypothetical protein
MLSIRGRSYIGINLVNKLDQWVDTHSEQISGFGLKDNTLRDDWRKASAGPFAWAHRVHTIRE